MLIDNDDITTLSILTFWNDRILLFIHNNGRLDTQSIRRNDQNRFQPIPLGQSNIQTPVDRPSD